MDRWYPVGPAARFVEGEIVGMVLGDRPVAICRSQGRIHAFIDQCPHRGTPFSESGRVDDGILLCRAHFWQFELESGRQTHVDTICLEKYGVRVDLTRPDTEQVQVAIPISGAEAAGE